MDKRVKAMEFTVEILRILGETELLNGLVEVFDAEGLSDADFQKRKEERLFNFISSLHRTIRESLGE